MEKIVNGAVDELAQTTDAPSATQSPRKMPDPSRNCLSYWHPRLMVAGVPTPRTEIVRTELRLANLLRENGPKPKGFVKAFHAFLTELRAAVDRIGTPCFLRTGQGSGKHEWDRTCYLADPDNLADHVSALIGWSEMVSIIGLPTNVWCVRELLPTTPICTLPAYGNMPLTEEVRGFVQNGEVRCAHPYWPPDAIEEGFDRTGMGIRRPANIEQILASANVSTENYASYVTPLLHRVAEAFKGDGGWSVDVLRTKRSWFVTDMAEADASYHWPGCKAMGKGEVMIRSKFTVHCDLCGEQRGPTFCSEYHADSWIEDSDEDYEEYGQFANGVTPRVTQIFHRAGQRLICTACVEVEIARLKKRNDKLEKVLEKSNA